MTGTVCLQGGGEFTPDCRDMDGALVRQADGPVVVTALAGAPGSDYASATANGVRHFRALAGDLPVLGAPDVRQDAPAALAALRRARLLVLPGGSPARLLRALQESGAAEVVGALLREGGTVLGASAGAMVLCAWTVLPEHGLQVVPGLGVVPDALVVPHWSGGRADWLAAVEAAVPPSTVVLGLPEQSGIVLQGRRATAVGRAASVLLPQRTLAVGESVCWPPAAG